MNIGDYVRTEWGIFKILEILDLFNSANTKIGYKYRISEYGFILKDNIIKSSRNIIDLIEVGDIVNLLEVNRIEEIDEDGTPCDKYLMCSGQEYIGKDNIKSILTHEQYENNCYRIERK